MEGRGGGEAKGVVDSSPPPGPPSPKPNFLTTVAPPAPHKKMWHNNNWRTSDSRPVYVHETWEIIYATFTTNGRGIRFSN
jgi:hypothetical protein